MIWNIYDYYYGYHVEKSTRWQGLSTDYKNEQALLWNRTFYLSYSISISFHCKLILWYLYQWMFRKEGFHFLLWYRSSCFCLFYCYDHVLQLSNSSASPAMSLVWNQVVVSLHLSAATVSGGTALMALMNCTVPERSPLHQVCIWFTKACDGLWCSSEYRVHCHVCVTHGIRCVQRISSVNMPSRKYPTYTVAVVVLKNTLYTHAHTRTHTHTQAREGLMQSIHVCSVILL